MKRLVLLATLGCALALAQEKGGERSESGEPNLGWKWANFAILVVFLGYMARKNLPVFFASRTEEIQKSIEAAQAVKKDADTRAANMDQRLKALGGDIERFRVEARAEMEQESQRIRAETVVQIKKLEQQAAQEIESSGKAATRELKVFAAELAMKLAEEQIRASLDPAAAHALVDTFVADLGRQEATN